MEPNPYEAPVASQQIRHPVSFPMRLAAIGFAGFSVLLIISSIAVLSFNPSRHEPSFIAQTFFLIGGLAIWSATASWQIWTHARTWPAYALVGFLSLIIAQGVATYGSLQLADVPMHPVLRSLRTIEGLYIMLLWPVLIWASVSKNS